VRDLQTGRNTELFRAAPGATIDDIALSPDGQQVALTLLEKQKRSSVLKLLPVAGGEASELVRAKEPEVIVGDSELVLRFALHRVWQGPDHQPRAAGFLPLWTENAAFCHLFAWRRTSHARACDGFCPQPFF
jgi:hypothetical protein